MFEVVLSDGRRSFGGSAPLRYLRYNNEQQLLMMAVKKVLLPFITQLTEPRNQIQYRLACSN